jgi:hypothetical protein
LAAVASFFVMARPHRQRPDRVELALNSITAAVLGGPRCRWPGHVRRRGGGVGPARPDHHRAPLPRVVPSDGSDDRRRAGALGIACSRSATSRSWSSATTSGRDAWSSGAAREGRRAARFYPEGTTSRWFRPGRKLIKGGTVLSLDPAVGDFSTGDVLIEGDRIVEVGPTSPADAEVIDATGMIVMPGFVDTHRHIWEGLLRNIGTDVPLEGRTSYISFVLHKLAPAFRPEDAYVGNLVSSLGAIDAGITTLLDWSHIQGSPAHTDAVIQALEDSGLRAVFAYGFPWWGKWEERQPSWFVRAATEHFSTKDQMLTLALAAPGPEFTDFEVTRDHWKLARETDARITTHVGVGSYGQDGKVQEFGRPGCSGPTPPTSTAPRSTTPRSR